MLVPVSGITTATRVTAGDEFACALLSNGTAKCWGLGESGQRGDGTFGTFALAPVTVNGLTGAVGARGRIWTRLRAALERDACAAGAGTAKGNSATARPRIPAPRSR